MTTPITDREIETASTVGDFYDCQMPGHAAVVAAKFDEDATLAHCAECTYDLLARSFERIRADAATIAELRGQVAELDARVNRLRATAEMGDLVMRSYSCLGGQCIGHGCAVCMMRDALSTLAPGDLGKDGT